MSDDVVDISEERERRTVERVIKQIEQHPGFENDIRIHDHDASFDISIMGCLETDDVLHIMFYGNGGVEGVLRITPAQWRALQQKIAPVLAHHTRCMTERDFNLTHTEARALNTVWRRDGTRKRWVFETTGIARAPKRIRLAAL